MVGDGATCPIVTRSCATKWGYTIVMMTQLLIKCGFDQVKYENRCTTSRSATCGSPLSNLPNLRSQPCNYLHPTPITASFKALSTPMTCCMSPFTAKPMLNEFRSKEEGRPIYDECDFVKIMRPGDSLSIIDTFVRPEHKVRFRRQWQAYQDAQGLSADAGSRATDGDSAVRMARHLPFPCRGIAGAEVLYRRTDRQRL